MNDYSIIISLLRKQNKLIACMNNSSSSITDFTIDGDNLSIVTSDNSFDIPLIDLLNNIVFIIADNDVDATNKGVLIGNFYLLSAANTYGGIENTLRKRKT